MVTKLTNEGEIMDHTEACEEQAEEYADRAAANGADYDDAYNISLSKCLTKHRDEPEEPDELDFN